MKPLLCTSKQGSTKSFYYEVDVGADSDGQYHVVRVFDSDPPNQSDDWFEARFHIVGGGLQVTMLAAREPQYEGQGITTALIPEVARIHSVPVQSSSNLPRCRRFQSEGRTVAADSVWKRMVAAGAASYDATVDRYTCPP
jgi:hypothetical protein